jgi:CheY-like chemotaxis protein
MSPPEKHTILVVDDDADIREVLTEVLEESGRKVVTASNGEEALGFLRNGTSPCLMLLDLMMPVMDGYRVLEARKQDAAMSAIPVVVITAGRSVEWDRLKDAEVVPKPLRLPALLSIVERYCRC